VQTKISVLLHGISIEQQVTCLIRQHIDFSEYGLKFVKIYLLIFYINMIVNFLDITLRRIFIKNYVSRTESSLRNIVPNKVRTIDNVQVINHTSLFSTLKSYTRQDTRLEGETKIGIVTPAQILFPLLPSFAIIHIYLLILKTKE
jgi:hypothetical protein